MKTLRKREMLFLKIERRAFSHTSAICPHPYPYTPPVHSASLFFSRTTTTTKSMQGENANLFIEHRTGTSPTQVRFPGAVRDLSSRVNFQCRLSYGVYIPWCGIACFYICAHIKDPVVHVRVRWIMETPKYPTYTLAGFPWGRQPKFPMGEIPLGQYS